MLLVSIALLRKERHVALAAGLARIYYNTDQRCSTKECGGRNFINPRRAGGLDTPVIFSQLSQKHSAPYGASKDILLY